MKHIIYGLSNPNKADEIRYIGYTSKGLERRLFEHINEAVKYNSLNYRLNWIRSLLKEGMKPIISVVEVVTADNWQERERFWIAKFSNLANSTAGGNGLVNPSQDVKDRISKKAVASLIGNSRRAGIAHTVESKKAISDGMKNSVKYREAMDNFKGVDRHASLTEEQKAVKSRKLSAARLACPTRVFDDVARKNISIGHTGLKQSEATKEKRRNKRFINNGVVMKQIDKSELLPSGWQFGMIKRT